MQILEWTGLNTAQKAEALERPPLLADPRVNAAVENIMGLVRDGGDAALINLTDRFDGVKLKTLSVSLDVCAAAWRELDAADKRAMQIAKSNIEAFHFPQKPMPISVETMPGVLCRREPRALESAGLYVPGGTAPLVSTLMMLALPAKLAGVGRCVVTTPPDEQGKINPNILAAAHLCGIDEIYPIGGAQAIAALSYGTKSIKKVAKIFGPGNAYVAAAKAFASQLPGGPAIDLPAGPSEAMVLADDDANPVFVASDLLSQAEHDVAAQVICICRSQQFADSLLAEIDRQLSDLPRKAIADASLKNGRIIITASRAEMVDIANSYAPEHLIVQARDPQNYVPEIRNAGSIFLGPWTPEAVGDYASGTNHTLPTNGAARAYSGVVLESFIKYISVQTLTREGLETLGPEVERLASLEGLEAHKRAISLRLKDGGAS